MWTKGSSETSLQGEGLGPAVPPLSAAGSRRSTSCRAGDASKLCNVHQFIERSQPWPFTNSVFRCVCR